MILLLPNLSVSNFKRG